MQENRTAFVTGGAKRIGAKIVEHLLNKGWNLIVHHYTTTAQNLPVKYIKANLNSIEEISNMLKALPVVPDLIINNAAIFEPDSAPDSKVRHIY